MTGAFERAFAIIVGVEGGHTTDPRDRGNWTGGQVGAGECRGSKFGISAASYPDLDIAALTVDQAREIYRRDFWGQLRCGEMPWVVALPVFDVAVNAGAGFAAITLQRAVGVAADGAVGPRTLAALAARDPAAVAAEVMAQRAYQMTGFRTWGTHGLGWMRRVMHLALQAGAPG